MESRSFKSKFIGDKSNFQASALHILGVFALHDSKFRLYVVETSTYSSQTSTKLRLEVSTKLRVKFEL